MGDIKHQPPRLALKFFRWYCRPDRLEELEGDLLEFYHLRLKHGGSPRSANIHFWWNVIRFYKPYAKSKTKIDPFMVSLFKSYFKLTIRHSWKNRGPVAINVVGLGLALSMCVFVYMMYAYNLEFDSFYKNTDDIYRVHAITLHNGEEKRNEFSPTALDDKLRNDISGINQTCSYFTRSITVKKGKDFFSERAGIVSADFAEMFEIPLRYGSFAQFGNQPIVYLTEALALKYFGKNEALGEKLMLYLSDDNKLEVIVGGVFEKIPLNSSFRFEILVSQHNYFRALNIDPNDWSNGRFVGHYLKLSSIQKEHITAEINRHILVQNEKHKELKIKRFELVRFQDPMPEDLIIGASYVNARVSAAALIIFSTLALMVFLIACFNLANTSMALIARRLKEIGIRKTLGSGSRRILIQFLFEMGIVSFLAFIIAVSTANLTSVAIMSQFGVSFLLQDIDLTGIILFISGFLLFTTMVAGLLPALYAWKFQPVAIMRKSVKLKGVSWLNKALTVAQYGLSIAVLVAGITFSQNADFLDELDLGYQDERIYDIPLENEYFVPIKREIDQLPGVVTAGAANHLGNFGRYAERVSLQIDTMFHEVRYYAVRPKYLDLMEVQIASGRTFLEGNGKAEQNTILVSQSFADQFFKDQEAINQEVKINGERKTIVGITIDIIDDVVKAAQLMPTVIALSKENENRHLVVKVSHGDMKQIEDKLKIIWSKYIDQPYTGFLQKDFALGTAGQDTKALHKIFLTLAILSGFLSIVGIFSLAKLNVTKRIKEISIRKVLGASLKELLLTINSSFIIILLVAMVVGSALGYLISNAVLDSIYKYHVSASLLTSLLSGLFIIVLALIMISSVAFVPAHSNPVNGLSNE
ncbi:permease prefix domain 2-containing transporter [Fulvivirgaceae bacterium BMA10]|uniref:Permease prefix domain 2-containing transporter n=1 Tax=Splendidivirga corallicola TaxID=3051826 RepID=A0ABT8KP91_9BACT|nr:permease prefix domain 2-containing transporter [Fulvivirgaceae bacterium BMA10]